MDIDYKTFIILPGTTNIRNGMYVDHIKQDKCRFGLSCNRIKCKFNHPCVYSGQVFVRKTATSQHNVATGETCDE
jgi:hypothetical protein